MPWRVFSAGPASRNENSDLPQGVSEMRPNASREGPAEAGPHVYELTLRKRANQDFGGFVDDVEQRTVCDNRG